jgi:hypothetical protein
VKKLTVLKQYVRWPTRDAWGFWAAFVPTLAGVWLAWPPVSKLWLVLLGAVLQVSGVGLAFWGLVGDAKSFGRDVLHVVPGWWDKRPWRGPRNVMAAAFANISATATMNMEITRLLPKDVDGRLLVLEADVKALWQADANHRNAIEIHKVEVKKQISTELASRDDKHEALKRQLSEYATADIPKSLLGLWLALLGTLLGAWVETSDAWHETHGTAAVAPHGDTKQAKRPRKPHHRPKRSRHVEDRK